MSDVFGLGQASAAALKAGAAAGGAASVAGAQNYYNGINPTIAANPQLQGDQQQLLNTALQRIQSGGLNAADLGRLNAIRASQGQQTAAGQAAAQSQAQQRGALQGNSGILGSMVAGQQAANTASNQGMAANQQALGESNAMLGQGSEMAGNLQNQGLGIQQANVGNNLDLAGAKANVNYNVANALNSVGTTGSQAIQTGANALGKPNWNYYNPGSPVSGSNQYPGGNYPVSSTQNAGEYSP